MQFNLLPSFIVFLGSYFPLAIIMAIQDIPVAWWEQPICTLEKLGANGCFLIPFKNPSLAITYIVVTAIAVMLAKSVLSKVSFPYQVSVKRSKAIPNEIINYTFPYVVSLMGVTYDEPQKLLGFAVFLLWMFAISHKSGQTLMNPLLLIFGWKLYEATINIGNDEQEVRVLMHGKLLVQNYCAQKIQDFYVIKG
jgi:hypothetical protein